VKKVKAKKKNKLIIKNISLFVLFILIINNQKNNHAIFKSNNSYIRYSNIYSDKWIVITTFNPPSDSIINLEKNINNWKIVVIGNRKTNDSNWNIFINSSKLIYLSIEEQNKLGYKILKYIKEDSFYRKNIGYVFAIQHGAKEIYETEENLNLGNLKSLNINVNKSYICYGKNPSPYEQKMINPYAHFCESNIWPRGFLINDIPNDYNKSIYYANINQINLKPLVYQGLNNKIPDLDSIFILTNGKKKENLNIIFSQNFPLLYLPDNYVPINSKNTKYLYEIFPFLMLPVTINESISDIIRGYILERFVFGYGGMIVFHNSDVYNENSKNDNSKLLEEKHLFFSLKKILEIIKSNKYKSFEITENPIELLFEILKQLIKNNFLRNEDITLYKAFLLDLSNIGYLFSKDFSSKIKNNLDEYSNINSKFIYYIPTNPNIINGNKNVKMIKHSSNNKIYDDILLIINYNSPGYLYLNKYMEEIYKKNFPNMVYIYPSKLENEKVIPGIIICPESNNGYYSYECLEKVYQKYPNFNGYFFINDDLYIKVWEFQYYDFSIPWFYIFSQANISSHWYHYKRCVHLNDMFNNNSEWKRNITYFLGIYKVISGFSDLYYIPQSYIRRFIELGKEMIKSKIFLECAVQAIFSIISAPKYHIIYIRSLWGAERKMCINVLHDEFKQISIHPIKFSKDNKKEDVRKYNYFINANDF